MSVQKAALKGLFLKPESHIDTFVERVWFLLSHESKKSLASQKFLGTNCLSNCKSSVNQGVDQQNKLQTHV